MPAESSAPEGGVVDAPRLGNGPLHIALLGLCFAVGAYLRLRDVGGAFLFGDEMHSLRLVAQGLRRVVTTFEPNGSGLALPVLQWICGKLLGLDNWSIRLPALLGGLGALALLPLVARRECGRAEALVATALLAVNAFHVFYSHFARVYALLSLLALVLLFALGRLVRREGSRSATLAGVTLSAGLLPYAHLASIGFVLSALAGALGALLGTRDKRKRIPDLVAAASGAAILAFVLYAPAWSSTLEFVQRKTTREYAGAFGMLDVLALLAGSRPAGLALAVLALLAAGGQLRERGAEALPLAGAALGPFVILGLTRPFGDAYAYARYLMPALPALVMLVAWLLVGLGRAAATRAGATAIAAPAAAAFGIIGAVACFLLGPCGPRRTDDGPYVNSYMALLPLPDFDVPWPGTPRFYRGLSSSGRRVTLLEAPALSNRIRHLYRNYYLQHRQPTLLGLFPSELRPVPSGPYVPMPDIGAIRRSGADYLVLHRDVLAEADRYWRFVYGQGAREDAAQPGAGRSATRRLGATPEAAAFMERHQRFGRDQPVPEPELIAALERALGPVAEADVDLLVWDLRRLPSSPGGHEPLAGGAFPPPGSRIRSGAVEPERRAANLLSEPRSP